MPVALDSFLARPSTLRTLRSILSRREPFSIESILWPRHPVTRSQQRNKRSIQTVSATRRESDDEKPGVHHVFRKYSSSPSGRQKSIRRLPRVGEGPVGGGISRRSSTPARFPGGLPSAQTAQFRSLELNLEHESNVLSSGLPNAEQAPLLVDHRNHKFDFELWASLLQYRRDRDGSFGVQEIWKGLRQREIDLPITGASANTLWRAFLKEGCLLAEVVPYAVDLARRTGTQYQPILSIILEKHLSRDPNETLKWYFYLKSHGSYSFNNLRRLARTLKPSEDALHAFRQIYEDNEEHTVYDSLMGNLRQRNEHKLASEWDVYLRAHHDLPGQHQLDLSISRTPSGTISEGHDRTQAKAYMTPTSHAASTSPISDTASTPVTKCVTKPIIDRRSPSTAIKNEHSGIRKLENAKLPESDVEMGAGNRVGLVKDLPKPATRISPSRAQSTNKASSRADSPIENLAAARPQQRSLSALDAADLEDPRETQQKQFGDAFCARLFATKSFPVSAVARGLGMLGGQSIGPLSLKQIILRTADISELLEALHDLKSAGVAIQSGVFSQTVRKLAVNNRHDRAVFLAQGEQHPDVLESWKDLHNLALEYLSRGDNTQAHYMLEVLAIAHPGKAGRCWNVALRHHCATSSTTTVQKFVGDMHGWGIRLDSESLTKIHRSCLRPRSVSKQPLSRGLTANNDLAFLVNVYKRSMDSGMYLHPKRWDEIIRRLGMSGAMKPLERLLKNLAAWYLKPIGNDDAALRQGRSWSEDGQEALRIIFRPVLVKAIIAWGFRYGLGPQTKSANAIESHEWARGLRLLRDLKSMGVEIRDIDVREGLRQRLLMLYGPGPHTARKWGKFARRTNPYSMEEVVQTAEKIWRAPIWSNGSAGKLVTSTKLRPVAKRALRKHRYPEEAILESRTPSHVEAGTRQVHLGDALAEKGDEEMIPVDDARVGIMRGLGFWK